MNAVSAFKETIEAVKKTKEYQDVLVKIRENIQEARFKADFRSLSDGVVNVLEHEGFFVSTISVCGAGITRSFIVNWSSPPTSVSESG